MKKKLAFASKKARNLLHDHPLLRKGGIHEKSKKTKRGQDKIRFKKEWFVPIVFAPSAI